ncbi:hypothetical protein FHR87_003776 [Azomonas macrocytogenes]|uniref:Uncharacterized protein n=1 Tax=Azomonas macrocytogenes TaxID=69962 RepID=A0A839T8Y9_AZOMA|nr:hypothetical protein [Azomonas macrocytogenes]
MEAILVEAGLGKKDLSALVANAIAKQALGMASSLPLQA